MILLYNAVALA